MRGLLFFVIISLVDLVAAEPKVLQRDESLKDFPSYVENSEQAAWHVLNNYHRLKNKEGYLQELPKISKDEIESIRNGSTSQNRLNQKSH